MSLWFTLDVALQQDAVCGDGTTGVVVLAAELLKQAEELVNQNIHPQVRMCANALGMQQTDERFLCCLLVLFTLEGNTVAVRSKAAVDTAGHATFYIAAYVCMYRYTGVSALARASV